MSSDLRPANPVTENVVNITVQGTVICLCLNEYNDEYRLLAREMRYQWQRPYWMRRIDQFNGPLDDRLIEAAYRLLRAGFIARLPDEALQERVIAGDYTVEHTRWISRRTTGAYTDWFAIQWARDENYFGRAKRITGARYSKPCVVVPHCHYDEVMDFAELHDFRLSPGAEKLIALAQEKRTKQMRVELQPRIETPRTKAAAAEITGEIADEFRDDN